MEIHTQLNMIKAMSLPIASLLLVLFTASVSCNTNNTTVPVLPSTSLSAVENQTSISLINVAEQGSLSRSVVQTILNTPLLSSMSQSYFTLSTGNVEASSATTRSNQDSAIQNSLNTHPPVSSLSSETIMNTSLRMSMSQTDVTLSTGNVKASSTTTPSIQDSTIQNSLNTPPPVSPLSSESGNSSTVSSKLTLSKTQESITATTSLSMTSSRVPQSSSIVYGTFNESSVNGNFMLSSTPNVNYTTTALATTSGYTSKTLDSGSTTVVNVSSYTVHSTGIDSTTTATTSAYMISYSTPLLRATERTTGYITTKSVFDSSFKTVYPVSQTTTSMYTGNSIATSISRLPESSALIFETSSIGHQGISSQANQISDRSITATVITTTSYWLPLSSSAHIIMTPSPVIRDEYLIFSMTSLLVNSTFTESLNNRTAKNYLNLAASVKNKLHVILNESEFYKDVEVVSASNFSNSIQVVALIYYNFSSTVDADRLNASIQTKSNSFVVISIKEICSNVSCTNGGSCQETTKDVDCSCKIGFNGTRCLSAYPVDGNYTSWSSYQSCSKSCGTGVQIRTRTCSSPPPMHGGRNCSSIGAANETKACNEHDCPDIDWVIWIIVGAGSFVLLLVIILACCFQKRKKFYYKDYGLTEDGRSYSLSRAAYTNKLFEGNLSEFRAQDNVVPMKVLKEDPFKNSYINQQYESDEANHNGNTVYERELKTFLGNTSKIRAKKPDDPGEYLEPEQTFHPPKNPNEIVTAQVVYENTPERML